ncbi:MULTISPECIES: hypothetical protein [Streptomyces]|uniref:Uncharacterized protein n=1 Tax=Streptomyces demainii TaxID=588122 RepID=A0ABT9L5P8_9ACTN|nr:MULTISPECIES: hypothetical protein [Streptomyces]MBW8090974.1 hypothetical protein [Streptomyces hygroscopicus subsp. hygroscopicus]MDN3058504.1 hypothetical protein [Streptomyces sp. SRF1]MDP9616030.1 hypothetical protein [Streptomyces demainii]
MNWNAQWVRDASVTVVDLVITAALVTGAMLLHARWLTAIGGLWALLTLRQGYLAARERKRSAHTPNRTRHRSRS